MKTSTTFPRLAMAGGALAVLLIGNGPALAAPVRSIDEQRPLAAGGQVTVSNAAGSVEISGWARDEVAISGTLAEDVEKLEISGDARKLDIVVHYPGKRRSHIQDTHLLIRVPARAQLAIETVSADVRISDSSGALAVKTVSGDINLQVGSGEIRTASVSGDLLLEGQAFDTTIESVSGDVEATGLRGRLQVETVSGDLEIAGGEFHEVALQSVSGDLALKLTLDVGAQLDAETLSGDIDIAVPQAPKMPLSLKSFSGSARNDFGTAAGTGPGQLSLRSFSGDIHFGADLD